MTGLSEINQTFRKLVQRIPRGQGFIWWMIKAEGREWIQFISPLLFLALFAACFWISYHQLWRALSISLAFLIQIYSHEAGHLFIFRRAGIRSRVWWLFPLGAVAAPVNREENEKSDRLPWWILAWLLQAGIITNVVLMGLGSILRALFPGGIGEFGTHLVYAGGALAVTNLIPFWQLDGSLFYHVIFSSLKEKDDVRVAIVFTGILGSSAAIALWSTVHLGLWQLVVRLIQNLSWLAIFLLVVTGVWHRQGMDDPTSSASLQAMTRPQALIHILVYILLLFVSLFILLGRI